jgi:hypothetical protein
MFVERFFTLLADAPRIRLSMLTLSASMHTLSGGELIINKYINNN